MLFAVDRGRRVYEVAPLFEVSVSHIYKALARRKATGIETALPKRGHPGRKLDDHVGALATCIAEHPVATLNELVGWSMRERGVAVCVATMWAIIQALVLTLKKGVPRRRAGAR